MFKFKDRNIFKIITLNECVVNRLQIINRYKENGQINKTVHKILLIQLMLCFLGLSFILDIKFQTKISIKNVYFQIRSVQLYDLNELFLINMS